MDISSYSSAHTAMGIPGMETSLNRNRSDPNLHALQATTSSVPSRLTADDDVFSSVGGVEIGREIDVDHHLEQAAFVPHQPDPTATPSRTLLVRNVAPDANEEELSGIFKSFGDVKTLFSDARHRGLLIVTFFDLRAAVSAKSTLHGTLVNNLPLEIHFSKQKSGIQDPWGLSQVQGSIVVYNLDPETTDEHLFYMFTKFGDVKEISQSPDRSSKKFVTFYDIRHAGAALKAMNRAETLGKLPSHITPQQAASMAYISGSSPSMLQLAALQLQHDGPVSMPRPLWDQSGNSADGLMSLGHTAQQQQQQQQQQGSVQTTFPQQHAGSQLHEMQLHISDSASSIASSQANNAGLFPSHGPSSLGKGIAASMAAAAGMNGGGRPATHSSRQNYAGSGGPSSTMYQPSSSGVNANPQHLLMQSGLSAAEAASVLMSMGLACSDSASNTQMMELPGVSGGSTHGIAGASHAWNSGGMYGGSPPSQGNSAAVVAALQEMQAMQAAARQQQMAAAHAQAQAQVQLASQLAGLQAQQTLSGMGASSHHMTAAQLIQAAQLNLGGNAGNAYMPHSISAAAAQLLQQAGLSIPSLAGFAPSQAGAVQGGRQGGSGPGDMMGSSAGGRGGDAGRGGGGGRLSRRTTDPAAEAERKAQQEKLYALVAEKIYSGQDKRTTLMIKNIPNKYTQKMLLATIDEHFHGTYDFFYLPIDFKNKCNVGYAFINMTQPLHIIPLVERFNHKKWERFNSEKVCNISYARIQGRAALISHFQNSSLMHEDKRCRPILFVLEGHEATGEQEPFPAPAAGGSVSPAASMSAQAVSNPPLSNSSSHPNLTASSSLASMHEGSVGSSSGIKGTVKQ